MFTKLLPREFTQQEFEFMLTLDEYHKRFYLATQAEACGYHGVRKVTKFFGVNRKTIYKAKKEIEQGYIPQDGRVRLPGGGRKKAIAKNPEILGAFDAVIAPYKAGLPQDESIYWISIGVTEIVRKMQERGCDVSRHIVNQILDERGYKRRSFAKNLTMKSVEDRDEQFENIKETRAACEAAGIPVLSIDTKKKELIGNFKRAGKVLCQGAPSSLDHDFGTFADAQIVPHGIYDTVRNVGYMSIGTSHDTSAFVCDNIARVWDKYLHDQYPDANTMVLLCDGGGSNASSHHIVKQDLMDLADRLGMNIFVMHYPPYCSKFNPIEHRLFSQITRSWSGAPLLSVKDAAARAEKTTTTTGLKVCVDIVEETYETKRKINSDYENRSKNQIVRRERLPKWNYLIKPT